MPFAECGDIQIYYETRGTGPRLLYISGTAGDLRRPPNVFTSSFPDRFEVLGFDQRGMGQTDKPSTDFTMRQYGDDAYHLLRAVGWEDCFVVGVSFGGMVAQELAINHPNCVKKLVLVCTSSGGPGGSSFPLHEIQDMPLEEKIRFRMSITDIRHDEKWQRENPEKFRELIDNAMAAAMFANDERGKSEGARRQLAARAKHDTYERLPHLNMPVLVCGGRHDGQAKPEVVKALSDRIPGAELANFDGGHMFIQQKPAAFEAIADFLGT
ncbi:MAG: alpha/beta fold hydrolase [Methyloligellaceae bacterium]